MLHLTDIRSNLERSIQVNTSMDSVKNLVEDNYYVIDFDVFLSSKNMNLQRPFVWSLFQMQQLVISVLKGIKLPSVSIVIHKEKVLGDTMNIQVIDGKQRMSTLFSFYGNGFFIEWNGNKYYFKDLSPEAQREISLYSFTANIMYSYKDNPVSDETKIKWFDMINWAGTPQDVVHINRLLKGINVEN